MDSTAGHAPEALATPPGPSAPPALLLLQWVRRPAQFLVRNRERHGPIFAARLGPQQNVVFLSDLEAISAAIASDGRDVRMGEANRFFRHVLGSSSILALDGDEHLRHRRLMAPGFRRSHVAKWSRQIEVAAETRLEALPRGVPVRLQPEFEGVAFDAAMAVVFGIQPGARSARIRELFPQVMDQTERPIHLLPWFRRELGGFSPWGRLMRLVEELDELLRAEIRDRRRDPTVERREDLLSLLCHAEQADGTPMTETELRDEMLTLLIAGQETTSAAMAWTFERLARTPRVADRLARAVADGDGGEYLDAVVRESLRLRPPVPVLARKAKVPAQARPVRRAAGVGGHAQPLPAASRGVPLPAPRRVPARAVPRGPASPRGMDAVRRGNPPLPRHPPRRARDPNRAPDFPLAGRAGPGPP